MWFVFALDLLNVSLRNEIMFLLIPLSFLYRVFLEYLSFFSFWHHRNYILTHTQRTRSDEWGSSNCRLPTKMEKKSKSKERKKETFKSSTFQRFDIPERWCLRKSKNKILSLTKEKRSLRPIRIKWIANSMPRSKEEGAKGKWSEWSVCVCLCIDFLPQHKNTNTY